MAAPLDPYTVLGVPRTADASAIRAAWRRLAKETHPDRNPDDPDAERRFKDVAAAWSVLSDPEARARYDRGPRRTVRDDPNLELLRQHALRVRHVTEELVDVLYRAVLPCWLERYERGLNAELAWRLLAAVDDLSFLDLAREARPSVGARQRAATLAQRLRVRVDLGVRRDAYGEPCVAELTLVRERGLAFAAITVWAGSLLVMDVREQKDLETVILPALVREVVRYLEADLPQDLRVLAWRRRTGRDDFPAPLARARRRDTQALMVQGARVAIGAALVGFAMWALWWAIRGRMPLPW